VLAKLCKYESLIDGTLDLCDIALLNDALLVRQDNEQLAEERARHRSGHG
jgi:hypothetical protein